MGPSRRQLGETTIKVPAPFAGIDDLGFTAQYREQEFNQPQLDVPLVFEGPEPPMRRLTELLRDLSTAHPDGYAWSNPVLLSDEVAMLAFRDRSFDAAAAGSSALMSGHMLNLVRPVVFAFLHDCALVAHLRLAEVIAMRVSSGKRAYAELAMPLPSIVEPNGDRLLWS